MCISQIIEKLAEKGFYRVEEYTFLLTQERIIKDQQGWDNEHPCKNMDFTCSPLWLRAGSETPMPYASLCEFIIEFWD